MIARPTRFFSIVLLGASLGLTSLAQAEGNSSGLMKDFDTLGGNDVLFDKAKAVNPESSIRVVQDRVVDRRSRFEFAPSYDNVLGGDAYNKTEELGFNVHFHITPHWSIGAKYGYEMNSLRPEGANLLKGKTSDGDTIIPDIDYPKSEWLALLNWYPIYGKMNLYDLGIAHFDIYAIAGYGQVTLRSGPKPTYTAGGGFGVWWSQHLSTRLEMRYQTYKATRYTTDEDMNLTVAGIQIGYML